MQDGGVNAGAPADPPSGEAARIPALDLIRGVAVLGILAVNIAGFAGPIATTDTPSLAYGHLSATPGPVDLAAFALVFAIFEGKMRAIFSMLFGASLLLFIARADAAGRDGAALQLRRLGWLAMFGWMHYVLFWWGDILFVYALSGLVALALRRMPLRPMVALALAIFVMWHGTQALSGWPLDRAEAHVRAHTATQAESIAASAALADTQARMAHDVARDGEGFAAQALDKAANAPGWPLVMTIYTIGETLPLMLIGMALYRSGFFAGGWSRKALVRTAVLGLGLGGVWMAALLAWSWPRQFPPLAMSDLMGYWAGPEHLAMGLGFAALLMLACPRLLATRLGQRLAAAGRMAFSNYLGTTMLMTAIFYRWGFGLYGEIGRAAQLGFVVAGWCVMLLWSQPWLARFRQGPLEWLWRSLTEGRAMPMRR